MIGRTISHYQVIEKLGAGGMGEIWKAQDARLNRMVAIKVLTNASAGDSDRRRRFIQEAQAASALNHPNIITIYDITHDQESEYMVMEYVAGKTLADLIPAGGLGVAKTLQYSVQIADALRAAHAAGIVHRDLKPGNVMVTDAGLVKILDFGLAKVSVATKLTEETQTMGAAPMTVEGSILGTVAYMSPEQAQGKKVDARSDIFSFGVVMYEMLTGAKAFAGDSAISTLTAILRDDVKPASELVPDVPPEVVEIIGLALKKDPKDRWQSMQVVHTVLTGQKQKFDSGVFTRSGVGQAPAAVGAPTSYPPSAAPVGLTRPRKSGRVWMWIAIGFGFVIWGRSCGSSRERAKIDTNIPGVSVSIPGVTVSGNPSGRTPKKGSTLTNQSILDLLEAEVPEEVIISHIRASRTKFTLTTDEIIKLTKAGATTAVIEAMRNPGAAAAKPESTPPVAPAPATPPKK
jgi:serine/threonine protein kinase